MKLMRCQNGPAVLQDGEAVLFSEINAKRGVTSASGKPAMARGQLSAPRAGTCQPSVRAVITLMPAQLARACW